MKSQNTLEFEEKKKPAGRRFLSPALVVLLGATLIAAIALAVNGGDPLALARLGTRYADGVSGGTDGYDGQFVYYIAVQPNPAAVAPHLDEPAYRYQRILGPLLARALALGQESLVPWAILLIGILSMAAGTWAVQELLDGWGVNHWYALTYGFWAGFTLALVVDLPEPLAYGLVAGAFLALERQRRWTAWLLLGLAAFAKEVTVLFTAAVLLAYLARRGWRSLAGLALVGVLPYLVFQGWLWLAFGQPGVGSGGAMATPFEIIPYMGLLRIGHYSLAYLAAMLLVFGPAVVLPSLWGVWKGGRFWLAGEHNRITAALLINAAVIAFTPFSTFRETGGIIRFASGLVLALLLFAGRYRQKRALNYSLLWIVLNVFLVK